MLAADPGFPVGGGAVPLGSVDLWSFSVETCVKTKVLGPMGGVHWQHPPDLPLHTLSAMCPVSWLMSALSVHSLPSYKV